MPTLEDIVGLFEQFGFTAREVKQALSSGDSAHNAFESLKLCLELRWGEMNQELSSDRLAELRPAYERLQGIRMTGRRTKKQAARAKEERKNRQVEAVLDGLEYRRHQNTKQFTEEFIKHMKAGGLDNRTKDALRKLGLGEFLDED